jgi:hypothetical protein
MAASRVAPEVAVSARIIEIRTRARQTNETRKLFAINRVGPCNSIEIRAEACAVPAGDHSVTMKRGQPRPRRDE